MIAAVISATYHSPQRGSRAVRRSARSAVTSRLAIPAPPTASCISPMSQRDAVHAHQEGRAEGGQGVGPDPDAARRRQDQQEARLAQQEAIEPSAWADAAVTTRVPLPRTSSATGASSRPTAPMMPKVQRQPSADPSSPPPRKPIRLASGTDSVSSAERSAAALGREIARDEGVGGGRAAGLPHGHPHARERQLPAVLGKAAEHGDDAPQAEASGDHQAIAAPVGHPGESDTHQGVDHQKAETVDQTNRGVRQVQVALDRLDHDRREEPVDDVDHVDERQQQHGAPDTCAGRSRALIGVRQGNCPRVLTVAAAATLRRRRRCLYDQNRTATSAPAEIG